MAKIKFRKSILEPSIKGKMPLGRKYKRLFLSSVLINISLIIYILLGLYNGQ